MELKHIDISQLVVSSANMRGVAKKPDLTNILPSVRARGILVPLIVRPNGVEGAYEIVAGKRRYHAALTVADEQDGFDPLPCAVMEAGDDAAALEASLIENIARLDPDEVSRCESFTRLVREGRKVEEIGLTFGLTSLQVKRTLAIGNLLPRIRTLYRTDKIDAVTMRHLTLATKAQQREWLALVDCAEKHAPTGSQLKSWLFGGSAIATKVAMFDLADYPGEIVSDLFGEDSYFADSEAFWTAQMAEVDRQANFYRDSGWADVVIMVRGAYFNGWEHERCPKKKGGKVFVTVSHRGEVGFHEGYLTNKEARQRAKGEANAPKPVRPEVSAALGNYIDLHRHAAVRAVAFDMKDYRDLDHGYAATIHKAQGMTVDRVQMLATPGGNSHLAYVGLSQHRQQVDLYYARSDFANQDKLIRALSRDGAKDMASDYREVDPARSFAERRGIGFGERIAEIARTGAEKARGIFDGLRLSLPGQPREQGMFAGFRPPERTREQAQPTHATGQRRAVERYARAVDDIARMRDRGLPVLPHQRDALNRAGEALDAIRPHASTDLQNALQRQPELIHEAADGRGQAAVHAMNKEAELRADPFQRADRFVEGWQQLRQAHDDLRRDGDFRGAKRVGQEMAGMAKSLERDAQVESLLRGRGRELGIDAAMGRSVARDLADSVPFDHGRNLGMSR